MFKEDNLFDLIVIKSYIRCNKLTKKTFCEACGINISVLNKIYAQRKDVLVKDLIQISNELNIPVSSLFKSHFPSKIQTRFSL